MTARKFKIMYVACVFTHITFPLNNAALGENRKISSRPKGCTYIHNANHKEKIQ